MTTRRGTKFTSDGRLRPDGGAELAQRRQYVEIVSASREKIVDSVLAEIMTIQPHPGLPRRLLAQRGEVLRARVEAVMNEELLASVAMNAAIVERGVPTGRPVPSLATPVGRSRALREAHVVDARVAFDSLCVLLEEGTASDPSALDALAGVIAGCPFIPASEKWGDPYDGGLRFVAAELVEALDGTVRNDGREVIEEPDGYAGVAERVAAELGEDGAVLLRGVAAELQLLTGPLPGWPEDHAAEALDVDVDGWSSLDLLLVRGMQARDAVVLAARLHLLLDEIGTERFGAA